MPNPGAAYKWKVIQQSVIGATHKRINLPNQDAIGAWSDDSGFAPVVLAVSDGHGSAKCFRSDLGSKIAVEAAIETCKVFITNLGESSPSVVKNAAELQLPNRLVNEWKIRVREHFANHEFETIELDRLEKEAGTPAKTKVQAEGQFFSAYGATLLVVIVTDQYIIYLQLGDGDILAVSDGPPAANWVLPKDEALIANETFSLCLENAAKNFRVRFQHLHDVPPELILVSTDGYANSYSSEAGFLKTGPDFLETLRTDGISSIENNLPQWLEEATEAGSGDDVTLGLIYRIIGSPTETSQVKYKINASTNQIENSKPAECSTPSTANDSAGLATNINHQPSSPTEASEA